MRAASPLDGSRSDTARSTPTSPLSRADWGWLAAAVLLALVLRLIWVSYATADPTDGRFDDSVFYHTVAASLAEGGKYNNPWTFLPTAQWPPGYPFFLTALYWLFSPSLEVAELANVVLGAATVGALSLLALNLFDSRSARIAALLLAVFPGQILFASLVYSETLFTFLFVLGLLLLVTAARRAPTGSWYWLVALGLVAGGAALVREAGLSLLVIGLAYWGLSQRDWRTSLRWTAIAVAAAGLLILPWTVRNLQTMDALIVISSSTGSNFWIGHHEGATGGLDDPGPLTREYGPLTRPGGEIAISNAGLREGLRFAVSHPWEELLLISRKPRALYTGDLIALDLNENYGKKPFIASEVALVLRPVANAFYYLVLAIAGFALVRWAFRRGQDPLLPVIAIGALTLGHVVFFGSPRFHFPIVPLVCLLAGWALAGLPCFAGTPRVQSSGQKDPSRHGVS